ncbi:stalk domain-containing protein [Paenibacillus thailandensis]|uniref:Stalk domain-containing protein n=1 Tax=Paenibacillus thailandensis TaxID=393250 RepID=A0ABW5QRS1_9BACL
MKKLLSLMVVFSLLIGGISFAAPPKASAASDLVIKTKQGGYVTLSNIVNVVKIHSVKLIPSEYVYISDGAVTLKIVGDDPQSIINYYPNGEIYSDELIQMFVPSREKKSIDVTGNEVVLSSPGFYEGIVNFGSDITISTAAPFIIQVVGDSGGKAEPASTPKKEPVNVSAKPTASKVLVNGKELSFQAYNIDNNNYFKLRDLAMVLNGTEKSISVGWNGDKNAISLESGKPYEEVGGELTVAEKFNSEKATLSTSIIYLDGKEVKLTAYLINGNNYFKLRDVAAVIDFGVTWDSKTNTIGIDSSTGYVME